MSKYILAIDQGTTSSRAVIINETGQWIAAHQEEFKQYYPRPGWVEHDAAEIWDTVKICIKKVLEKAYIKGTAIAGIGITNQRETVVLWNRSQSRAIGNAIVWQDRRTQSHCQALRKKNYERKIREKTGLLLDPYFSATKIQWKLASLSKTERQQPLACGTIDSWLVWNLTGGHSHVTDVTNASRTSLMNLKTLDWDPALLKIFKVPASILPEIKASNSLFGKTSGLDFLPDGIPITGILGDQQAALFGQNAFREGDAKCTFGTGSFLLMNCGPKIRLSKNRLLTTVAWQIEGESAQYALEGSVFICGAAVQWLRDGLGIIQSSSEVEELAAQVPDSGGVHFVPALTGLGAPYWDSDARGIITGLTRGTTKAHIARATLEAMAMQNVEVLACMERDSGRKLREIKVDGGAVKNNLLMQLQADLLGVSVVRPQIVESTVLGAAFMAGLGCGLWKSEDEVRRLWNVEHEFAPKLKASARKQILQNWKNAVERALR
jgi:glycerol kinase